MAAAFSRKCSGMYSRSLLKANNHVFPKGISAVIEDCISHFCTSRPPSLQGRPPLSSLRNLTSVIFLSNIKESKRGLSCDSSEVRLDEMDDKLPKGDRPSRLQKEMAVEVKHRVFSMNKVYAGKKKIENWEEHANTAVKKPKVIDSQSSYFVEKNKEASELIAVILAAERNGIFTISKLLDQWLKSFAFRKKCEIRGVIGNEKPKTVYFAYFVPYNDVSIVANKLIQALIYKGMTNQAIQVFHWIMGQGWCQLDPTLPRTLIYIFGKSNSAELALLSFKSMADSGYKLDTSACNALLNTLLSNGLEEEGFRVFHGMRSGERVAVNISAEKLTSIDPQKSMDLALTSLDQGNGTSEAANLSQEEQTRGADSRSTKVNPRTNSLTFVDSDGKNSVTLDLGILSQSNTATWNTVLSWIVRSRGSDPEREPVGALFGPNSVKFGFAGCMEVVREMVRSGASPDTVTYNVLLKACVQEGRFREASLLFGGMERKGPAPDAVTYSTMVGAHSMEGKFSLCREVLGRMQLASCHPNARTFTALIASLAGSGRTSDAVKVLRSMAVLGIVPNVASYNAVLQGHAKVADCDGAEALFREMRENKIAPSVVSYTTLMSAYGNAGDVDKSVALLAEMEAARLKPNVVTYTVLMKACLSGRRSDLLPTLLERMRGEQCRPNEATCGVLLLAVRWHCMQGGDAFGVLEGMRGFGTGLAHATWRILVGRFDSHEELVAHFEELLESMESPSAYVSLLLDAMWNLGMQRRGASLLVLAKQKKLLSEVQSFEEEGWKLDLSDRSSGGAKFELYSWLVALSSMVKELGKGRYFSLKKPGLKNEASGKVAKKPLLSSRLSILAPKESVLSGVKRELRFLRVPFEALSEAGVVVSGKKLEGLLLFGKDLESRLVLKDKLRV